MSVIDRVTALFKAPRTETAPKPLPPADVPTRLAHFWWVLSYQIESTQSKR